MPIQTQVTPGVQQGSDSAPMSARGIRTGEAAVSEVHGRFYEQTYRGAVFGFGMALTSINNATFAVATTGVTATPILGVWNPVGNGVNLVILQARLALALTALQATGGGPFVWTINTAQSAISTGSVPINRKTLVASGSSARAFCSSPALTGMSGALTLLEGSELNPAPLLNLSFLQTAAGTLTPGVAAVQNFDGSLIVPPGGLLALQSTSTPVANSCVGGLTWEEVPV